MRKIIFSPSALNDLKLFKSGNQKLVFKIFEIVTDIQTDPFKGIGKPEPLKENFKGFWSRRISDEHRLVYKVTDDFIEIHSCYGHYNQ
jgi:toxin YoeB